MFALFGFLEAAKFRDLGEFSDCIQNVGGKVTKKILHGAKPPRNATSFPEPFPLTWRRGGNKVARNEFRPKVLRSVSSGSRKR